MRHIALAFLALFAGCASSPEIEVVAEKKIETAIAVRFRPAEPRFTITNTGAGAVGVVGHDFSLALEPGERLHFEIVDPNDLALSNKAPVPATVRVDYAHHDSETVTIPAK